MILKEWLKKWLPAPAASFYDRINTLESRLDTQEKQLNTLITAQKAMVDALRAIQATQGIQATVDMQQQLAAQIHQLEMVQATADGQYRMQELLEQVQKYNCQMDAGVRQLQQLPEDVEEMRNAVKMLQDGQKRVIELQTSTKNEALSAKREASEAVWGEIFNNATSNSTWLQNKAFSPGRWAVGYPALYGIYRILNEVQPKQILELGLGQSTRMIAQYAAAFADVEHIVVEHDPEWIAFFENGFPVSERTNIVQLDREMVPYKEAEAVRTFKGFKEAFSGKKFDFIFIDAPLGSDMKQYSRIDVLGILPQCLEEQFVIMIDDYMRRGEQNTVEEIKIALKEKEIECCCGIYRGGKDTCVVTSKSYQFLSTL